MRDAGCALSKPWHILITTAMIAILRGANCILCKLWQGGSFAPLSAPALDPFRLMLAIVNIETDSPGQ